MNWSVYAFVSIERSCKRFPDVFNVQNSLFNLQQVHILIPITASITLFVLIILGLYHQPYKHGIGLLLCVAGVPVYWVLVLWKRKPVVHGDIVGKKISYSDLPRKPKIIVKFCILQPITDIDRKHFICNIVICDGILLHILVFLK